jgi:hypothetical protein
VEEFAMIAALLSLAFGFVSYALFSFGFGSSWEFSLSAGVVTAFGLWLGNRLTSTEQVHAADCR